MRHLSKPEPPENVRPNGQEPQRFVEAEQEYLDALQTKPEASKRKFAKETFDDLYKRKLREVMSEEQAALCVYCERRISENWGEAHIEHWRPQSRAPEFALHWDNLYLSCETPDTCGIAKGDLRLAWDDADPDLPWPTEYDYEQKVGFSRDGRIYVRNDVPINGITRRALNLAIDDHLDGADPGKDAILNLNHPDLLLSREAAIDSERERMKRDYGNSTATAEEREKRAAWLLGRNPLPDFVSIRVAYLRMQLGRGR